MPFTTHAKHQRFTAAMRRKTLASLFAIATLLSFFAADAPARQRAAPRDHLTVREAELVRDAQRIDQRTNLFIKAIDRRLLILAAASSPATADAKAIGKDAEKYGAIPQSTAAELLSDIERILDEAITNMEDVSEHKRQEELLPKALRKLSDASTRYLTQLTPLRQTADAQTRPVLERTIEKLDDIVDAAKDRLRDTEK